MVPQQSGTDRFMAVRLGLAAVAMFGFGFALVPLYDIFCEVTGIRAPIEANNESDITEAPELSRTVRLEMLASTSSGAPWEFYPANDSLNVQTGLMQNVEYTAHNLADMELVAVATPDVRPGEAAKYFRKVECFCFEEQNFAAGEQRELEVRFFIEPDLPAHIDVITLGYTLYQKTGPVASTIN